MTPIVASATSASSGALLRLAAVHANSFVMDLLRLVRGDRDVLDAFILLCLYQANPPSLAAGLSGEAVAPGELRPISVGGIANSLNMPFETVRRRAAHLCADGLCRQEQAGIVLVEDAPQSPARPEVASTAAELLTELYFNLRRGAALSELKPQRTGLHRPYPVLEKAMFRLSSAYLLRMLERMRTHARSVIDGAVILAVYRGNASALAPADTRLTSQSLHPLSGELRPMRVAEIASVLGMPYETVRRHIKGLVADGALSVRRKGVIVPRSALAHPVALGLKAYNYACLLRLFEGCARLGLQARWEVVLQDDIARRAGGSGPPGTSGASAL